MRKQLTAPERLLWHQLRAARFKGIKFRRQVVIANFIADFACRHPVKLVIELDGDTHGFQQGYDRRRTRDLEQRGYRVIRFANHDVMHNMEGVLQAIDRATPPSPGLSPKGETGSDF